MSDNTDSLVLLKTVDPEELQAVISKSLRPALIRPGNTRKHHFFFQQTRLKSSFISLLEGENPIDIGLNTYPQDQPGYIFWIQLTGSSWMSLNRENYFEVPEFHACISTDNAMGNVRNSNDSKQFFIRFKRALLEKVWSDDASLMSVLDSGNAIKLPSLIGTALQRYILYVLAEFKEEYPSFRKPCVAAHTEQLLIALLMQTLANYVLEQNCAIQGKEPPYISVAEKIILDNLDSELTIDDLLTETGVSMRTLYRGFKAHKGCSPMAFIRGKQLEKAHAALMHADPARTTVTDIAYQLGFNHLSHFAALYKSKFGYSPSQTLSKKF